MSGVHGENASVLDCGSKGDAGEFLFHQIRPAEKTSVIFRTLIRPSAFSVSGNLIHVAHVGGLRQIQRCSRNGNIQIAESECSASVL